MCLRGLIWIEWEIEDVKKSMFAKTKTTIDVCIH
jgi:hypothetical protein